MSIKFRTQEEVRYQQQKLVFNLLQKSVSENLNKYTAVYPAFSQIKDYIIIMVYDV